MYKQFLFLSALLAALGSMAVDASAQAVDSISAINGQTFENNAQPRYFNRRDCGLNPQQGAGGTGGSEADGGIGGAGGNGGAGGALAAQKAGPQDTTLEIRLENTAVSVTQVWLWTGTGGAECEKLDQRQLENLSLCAEIAGNPRNVATNLLIQGLTLQDLIDAKAGTSDIVQCETSGLEGTPYKIFAFRGQPPSGDVAAEAYGVADFFVDVESPAAPLVNTSPQEASTFTISWANPNPPDQINGWEAWYSDVNDPSTATRTDLFVQLGGRSINIAASELGLTEPGETAYVFMQAFDQAIISNDTPEQALAGNQSELSEGVEVTFVDTVGFCDGTGNCTGCSAMPMSIGAPDGPSAILWVFGLLVAMSVFRRRRR
ncbi:MAG: hypothetical protein WBN70_03055 [Polyangiales bacterium]|jgi:hypothetical protein